ncbi:helix-turn-helix transcriptional regulator [Ktedonosporobacter rubrisoli]|nr:helix-turn-helix transcriptional regulator [Ktedonosporobacter rubrisoli]
MSTPLNRVLLEYQKQHKLKQQPLADYLNVDVRTIWRWLSGETVITDIRELKRIARLLDISPEALGVAHTLTLSPDAEQIEEVIEHIWKLVRAARYYEANTVADQLLQDIIGLLHTEDTALVRKLARAQHITGYVKSQVTRANETSQPFSHYHEMEQLARIIDDQTLLNIALTYEGDMLQRGGMVEKGIEYLEAARDTTPQAELAAKGNGLQLLGRAYFKAHRLADFDRVMKEAEEIAYQVSMDDLSNSTRGQYNVGTVYEEFGRSYGLLGQFNQAMEYLDKAEAAFSSWSAQRRDVLMKTARAMVLVRGGEIRQGIDVAVESVELCRKYGNFRLLDRVYGIQQYLDRLTREIGNAGSTLREALDGPIEY